jgi:chromosome segregation ATPase
VNSSFSSNPFLSAITLMGLVGVICLGVWGCSRPAPPSAGPSQARLRALELRCVQLEQDYRIVAEIRDSAQREVTRLQEQLLGQNKLQNDLLQWRGKYQQLANMTEQAQSEVSVRTRERDALREQLVQRTQERDRFEQLSQQRTRERDELQIRCQATQKERESLRKQLQVRMKEREVLIARCDSLRKGLKALLDNDTPEVEIPSDGND